MSEIDLDKPSDARKFLRGVRIQGRAIDYVQLANGKTISIEDMDDQQICAYAKDIYFDYCGGVEGEGGFIELEGVNQ